MRKVLMRVNILVCIIYLVVGIFGYWTFTSSTENLTKQSLGGIIIVIII